MTQNLPVVQDAPSDILLQNKRRAGYVIEIHNKKTGGITRFHAEDMELVYNQGRVFQGGDAIGPNGQERLWIKACLGCKDYDSFQAETNVSDHSFRKRLEASQAVTKALDILIDTPDEG
jgi:hypothetical protein